MIFCAGRFDTLILNVNLYTLLRVINLRKGAGVV